MLFPQNYLFITKTNEHNLTSSECEKHPEKNLSPNQIILKVWYKSSKP